jgi:hypothetical protein
LTTFGAPREKEVRGDVAFVRKNERMGTHSMLLPVAVVRGGAGVAALLAFVIPYQISERFREHRHASRPRSVAERLLQLANVNATDVVYDLECGDGTLSVTAAYEFGARAVCVDEIPRRIAEARGRAREAHVEHLVTFRLQDWQAVDISPASVIVLFKTGPWHFSLRGHLTAQARPGARIVSFRHDMGVWQPAKIIDYEAETGRHERLMLWIADGTFRPAQGLEAGPQFGSPR